MSAKLKTVKKLKFRFLEGSSDKLFAEPTDIDSGAFRLLPPRFEPLSGEAKLADGTPPTAVGLAVMEWWAACTGRPSAECPTGLVRAIEAVSASGDNVAELRRAFRGSGDSAVPRWRRNHAGRIAIAEIDVLVPLVGPATVQPRESARTSRIMRDQGLPLIHEVGEGLVLRGRSASHFRLQRQAQIEAIDPGNYSHADRKNFVDSLALEGIREPLRGFVYRLEDEEGQGGHLVETDDGFTRVSVSQATMKVLLGGMVTDLSRLHWEDGEGGWTIRDWTPDRIVRAHEALRFDGAPFRVWPEIATSMGVRTWAAAASAHALATMRMMTARMEIGILVEPRAGSTTHMVAFADMARYHVRGHQPAPWSPTDDEGFKARTIVSRLAEHKYVSADQKDVIFGNARVPWTDDPKRTPYRNRLIATIDTMLKCVVEDPRHLGRYPEVRASLKQMRVPNSPTQAAAAAASMAVVVAGLEGDGEMGACSAMLKASFANPVVRRPQDHDGNWVERLEDDLGDVIEGARGELSAVLGTAKHGTYLGPNMRALALMAMVAHGINPALVGYRKQRGENEDGTPRLVRWPSSMTRTGRGGRGGGVKADAHVVLFNAVRSPLGIDQLAAIVRAVIDHEGPVVPLDPATGEELLEDHLREVWRKAPTIDGDPVGPDVDDDEDDDDDGGLLSPQPPPELSETGEWDKQVANFADELRGLKTVAESLRRVAAGRDALGLDADDDWDPDDDDLARMLEAKGINPELAPDYDENLEVVRKFFFDGVMAFFKGKTRS